MAQGAESLQQRCETVFLGKLKEVLTDAEFVCGHSGAMEYKRPISLFLEDGVLNFPLKDEGRDRLIRCCEPASFGKGKETVFDPSYRNAGQLSAEKYALSFDLVDGSFLEKLNSILRPYNPEGRLRAERERLNIYSKDGFFRSHQDTPKSGLLATLVFVLPSEFEGGELTVQQKWPVKTRTFLWPDKTRVQYATFFSDCKHEVLPVTSGLRVTVAYSLYAAEREVAAPSMIEKAEPCLFQPMLDWLAECLQMPAFMPDGCILGVYCMHQYAVKVCEENTDEYDCSDVRIELDEDPTMTEACLKGADAALAMTAKHMGLKVELVCQWEDVNPDRAILSSEWTTPSASYNSDSWTFEDMGCEIDMEEREDLRELQWCNSANKQVNRLGGVADAYGNESYQREFYHHPVICIHLPAASHRDLLTENNAAAFGAKKRKLV